MNETLQEFVDSRGQAVRVDRQAGVVRGVKILGLRSRNRRAYLAEALAQAAALYEDAKVNVNHPKGNPGGPRDYQDRIGVIRNVAFRPEEGLFADFHFNPKHALAEQLAWDAEHAPENVGFSHNVEARTARRGDEMIVEEILRVQSVDLVADPATTRGLFESAPAPEPTPAAIPESLTAQALKQLRPDLVAQLLQEQAAELERLRGELAGLRAGQATEQKRAALVRLLREFELPDPDSGDSQARLIVDRQFLETAMSAEGEEAMRELVAGRARLVRAVTGHMTAAGRPQSREQHAVFGEPLDTQGFVKAIC